MATPYNHINGRQQSNMPTNSTPHTNGVVYRRINEQPHNDFINHREINNTSNQTDMSSSSAQLTSKTALLVRQRRAMLEQLSCVLCQGYLIDAVTIDECMDSFCRSCIIKYLRTHNDCPKCGTILPKPKETAVKSDKILQDIVYKLIPGLYDNEMKRRRDFYRRQLNGAIISSSDDDEEEPISLNGNGLLVSGEKYGVIKRPKPFYKPTDTIDLSIEPQTRSEDAKIYYDTKRQSIVTCFTGSLRQRDMNTGQVFTSVDSHLFKTYLRCPAKFTIARMKKFIIAKFNVSREDTIHLFYLNESLKEEYSLIDIAYIYDWRGLEHMQLFYVIERDLSKTDTASKQGPASKGQSPSFVRQTLSVGTQASKRVCIDPEPRFCEEKNNISPAANSVGRSMRSRDAGQVASSSSNTAAKPATTNPIIKSSPSPDKNFPATYSNGLQTRGVSSVKPNTGVQPSAETSRSLRSQQPVSKYKHATATSSNNTNNNNNITRTHDNRSMSPFNLKPEKNLQTVAMTSKSTMSGMTTAPSSLVTLANFTEVRTNHVMATVTATTSSRTAATSATTMSYPNRNSNDGYKTLSEKTSPTATIASKNTITNSQILGNQGTTAPRLAFSFVTERGITIVQRLGSGSQQAISVGPNGNRPQGTPSSSAATSTPASQLKLQQDQQASSNPAHPSTNNHRPSSMSPNLTTSKSSASPQGSSNSSSAGQSTSEINHRHNEGHLSDGVTPRHQIKVKPVYKTFVDPTKLKSPNLKKLGFTARH